MGVCRGKVGCYWEVELEAAREELTSPAVIFGFKEQALNVLLELPSWEAEAGKSLTHAVGQNHHLFVFM